MKQCKLRSKGKGRVLSKRRNVSLEAKTIREKDLQASPTRYRRNEVNGTQSRGKNELGEKGRKMFHNQGDPETTSTYRVV